jgi:hypothetical protein
LWTAHYTVSNGQLAARAHTRRVAA